MIDLNGYQRQINEWQDRNFGPQTTETMVLGMMEEIGEVARYLVKRRNRIRSEVSQPGTVPHEIGDVIVFALQVLTNEGWEAERVLGETFERVLARDWKLNPENGGDDAPSVFVDKR